MFIDDLDLIDALEEEDEDEYDGEPIVLWDEREEEKTRKQPQRRIPVEDYLREKEAANK